MKDSNKNIYHKQFSSKINVIEESYIKVNK